MRFCIVIILEENILENIFDIGFVMIFENVILKVEINKIILN